MKIKNKLTIILSIIILLLFICNNVFAAEGDFESIENFQLSDTLDWNTVKINFTEEYITNVDAYPIHLFLYNSKYDYFNLVCANNIYYAISNETNNELLYTKGPFCIFKIKPDSSVSISYNGSSVTSTETLANLTTPNEVVYTDTDIYDQSGENLVFQGPPQEEIQESTTVLAPIVEGAEAQKTLQEILKILPKILVVLVSYLGLRKALRMLSALLHRS